MTIKPTLHHVNLKTTRLKEMIDWYGVVVGTTVNLQSSYIAFISNDRTHHRIALLAIREYAMIRRSSSTREFTIPRSNTTPLMT